MKKNGVGFEKEHLQVNIDDNKNLKVSGRCPLDGRLWRGFQISHSLPPATHPSRIRATFNGNLLTIIIPKPIADPEKEKDLLLCKSEEKREKKEEEAKIKKAEEKKEEATKIKRAEENKGAGRKATEKEKKEKIEKKREEKEAPGGKKETPPVSEFRRKEENGRELVANAVAAALVLLALAFYIVYRYKLVADSHKLGPMVVA